MAPKQLTVEEVESLKKWLTDNQIIWSIKIHRDMSDGVAIAALLKKFYPKMIDLHNYPPRNSTQLKLDNWETLNHKVLIKLGLQQTKSMLDKLARAQPSAIEALLYDIMLLDKSNRREEKIDEQEQIWSENDDVIVVNVNKKVGDAIVQVPQKMILYSIYEETVRDSQSKDSYLSASQQKIAHLENILRLKSDRVDELCAQLAKQSVRSFKKNKNNADTATAVEPASAERLAFDDFSGQSSQSLPI